MSRHRVHPGPSELSEATSQYDDEASTAHFILQLARYIIIKKRFYYEWCGMIDTKKVQFHKDALDYGISRLSIMYGVSHAADSLIERMQVCRDMLRLEYERFESYAELSSPGNNADEKAVYFNSILNEACHELDEYVTRGVDVTSTWFTCLFKANTEAILARDFDNRSLISALRRQLFSLRELLLQDEEQVECEELDRCIQALDKLQHQASVLDVEAQLFTEMTRPDARNG